MEESLEQVLERDGVLTHAISGGSMRPMLNEATDLVKIVPQKDPLKKGDLPLYRRPDGTLILHRIIAVRKKYCVTCGDNCSFSEKVPYEWIIGVTEGYYKDGVYIPCTDGEYLEYVQKRIRGRYFKSSLLRFRIFRLVRKCRNRLRRKKS